LRALLISGLPADDVNRKRAALVELSRRLGSAGATPEIIQLQLDNNVAMARIRATTALGKIATSDAKDALCAGRPSAAGRPDVQGAISDALDKLNVVCP
jgi:hypothetical protein